MIIGLKHLSQTAVSPFPATLCILTKLWFLWSLNLASVFKTSWWEEAAARRCQLSWLLAWNPCRGNTGDEGEGHFWDWERFPTYNNIVFKQNLFIIWIVDCAVKKGYCFIVCINKKPSHTKFTTSPIHLYMQNMFHLKRSGSPPPTGSCKSYGLNKHSISLWGLGLTEYSMYLNLCWKTIYFK